MKPNPPAPEPPAWQKNPVLELCNKARSGGGTCAASRHVQTMAEALLEHGHYPMFDEEPVHCAESMLSVVASVYQLRQKHAPPAAAPVVPAHTHLPPSDQRKLFGETTTPAPASCEADRETGCQDHAKASLYRGQEFAAPVENGELVKRLQRLYNSGVKEDLFTPEEYQTLTDAIAALSSRTGREAQWHRMDDVKPTDADLPIWVYPVTHGPDPKHRNVVGGPWYNTLPECGVYRHTHWCRATIPATPAPDAGKGTE